MACAEAILRIQADGTYLASALGQLEDFPLATGAEVGKNIRDSGLPGDLIERSLDAVRHVIRSGETEQLAYELDSPRGPRHFEAHFMRGGTNEGLCVVRDVSDQFELRRRLQEAEARLDQLARYDQLTGLPNRLNFRTCVEEALRRAERHGMPVALMCLNLDRFKHVNESGGQDIGDALIRTAAERLRGSLRSVDVAARLSGDEFAVLIEGVDKSANASIVAGRIIEDLSKEFWVNGDVAEVGVSLGLAVFPEDAETGDELLRCADAAARKAKRDGGSRYQFYDPKMTVGAKRREGLSKKLRRALDREQFRLHYQPKVNVATGAIVGVEALLRWQTADRLVPPFEFVPVLEETGLIVPVGHWVLRAACSDAARWMRLGLGKVHVAVNISARQFKHASLVDVIEDALSIGDLPPEQLDIELTESLVMDDTKVSLHILGELKRMGVRISVDDFGTGYSSLAYLKRFPVDELKVDRTFIKDIPDKDDGAIASSIIALAHSLGMSVVAEGVETEDQLEFVRQRKCNAFQGYLFSKPIPADECLALMQAAAAPDADAAD